MYESAEVIGTDLSPIQPSFVPPNVSFMVDDAEAEWTFNKKFDFINMRGMVGSFMDISKVIQRCYDNLKPGGWLEIPDVAWPMYADDETIEGSAVYKWSKLMVEAGAKLGRPLTNVQKYGQMLRDSGFTNISEKVFRWPINDWPQDKHYKTLGLWARQNLLDGLQALSMKLFTLALGWKSEEVEVFLVDVRKEVMSRKIHGYYAVYDVYGQKPISNLPESD
ncbi:MAG: hypothetical protein M1834_003737 [Cirrosporium novae-zelandiae]|nr:MAG: hypothetical protein M1834_003737 [Cirrosporium novae-zelandiae]